ncbi:MAG TPA: hypothetical protein VLY04_15250 [Bryobacteraceae bacterium]|nr:hypothetical protein [Bryobacteraceae bacterium]
MIGSRLALLTLSLQCAARATVIFLTWRPDMVAVSVDGLRTFTGSDRAEPVCKVVHTPDCFAVFAGAVEDPRGRFQAMPLAQRACESEGDIFAKSKAFETEAREQLQKFWADYKVQMRTIQSADKVVLNVVFAGVRAGSVGLVLLRFGETADGGIDVIDRRELPDGRTENMRYKIGDSKTADTYLAQHPEASRLDPAEFVRTLMSVALEGAKSEAKPRVGPPAAIFSITPAGVRWIETGACTAP